MATFEISVVYTDAYKAARAVGMAQDPDSGDYAADHRIDYFKIGEGGSDAGPGSDPVDPDPALTDIEAQGIGVNGLYYFEKDLVEANVVVLSPGVWEITITVASDEANDDGLGANPEFFEIGVFDKDDVMFCYGTFSEYVKVLGKTLEIVLTVTE